MNALDRQFARSIIIQLGSSGQPPEFGVQYFSAGLDPFLDVIDEEYLRTFIKDGGSAFKMVVGAYGGGKTHFLYSVRNLAWQHGFAVSYVSLRAGGECPFDKLDLVYKAIIDGLLPPIDDPETKPADVKGIENFLRYWYAQRLDSQRQAGDQHYTTHEQILADIDALEATNISSISFRKAMTVALRAIMDDDERCYGEVCQWLKGEASPSAALKRLGITQRVDKTTAFKLIRSVGQTMRGLGYSGLVVLLDEAERVSSLSRAEREQLLSNLREFIDECGQSEFQGMLVFYAVPNRGFLDGKAQVYEALRQRLATTFDFINPTGAVIGLDDAVGDPEVFLHEVGAKIVPIYNTAYDQALDVALTTPLIKRLAASAVKQRFADAGYKRLFVQQLVQGLGMIHRQGRLPEPEELELRSS